MTRPVRNTIAIAVSVGLVVGGGGVLWVWNELNTPAPFSEGAVTVELSRGLHAGAMFARLHDAGVLESPRLLRMWVALTGGGEHLHAGEYRFDQPLSPLEVLARLERGEVVLHALTLPEGLDLEEVAGRVVEAGFGELDAVLEVFRDPALVLEIDDEAEDLEGYLFPETYQFPRDTPPAVIAETMVRRFDEMAGEDYVERARAVGLTLREAVTLASMIEKETAVPEERWTISRVFHNRLDRGMLLQCDPTVLYAHKKEGRVVRRLTYRDLELVSPWNTYVTAGLPPGPICSPGRDSLEAAVEPAEGEELYFVAAPGGGHRFSTNLQSHLDAVKDWRKYQSSIR